MSDYPERVLVTKIGFDGHDRGSRVVASYLRDAGMEVIYTPPWQEIDAVINLVIEEDIEVIGVSSLATDHLILPDLMSALSDADLGHVQVVVGGIIPAPEHAALRKVGISGIFGPGTASEEIVARVHELALKARSERGSLMETT